jgi:hypothetical protein
LIGRSSEFSVVCVFSLLLLICLNDHGDPRLAFISALTTLFTHYATAFFHLHLMNDDCRYCRRTI